MGTSSIFSFSFLAIFTIIGCNSFSKLAFPTTDWTNQIPPGRTESALRGKFVRLGPPKSGILSKDYNLSSKETLEFHFDRKVEYVFEQREEKNKKVEYLRLIRSGEYTKHGNWMLIEFKSGKEIKYSPNKDSKKETLPSLSDVKSAPFSFRLVYFCKEDKIIPTKYDWKLEEKDFGIFKFMSGPFAEDDKLEYAIEYYTKKEFHDHAYYKLEE